MQALECLADGDVVDMAHAVQEEPVRAEPGAGGPGLNPCQVDISDRELIHGGGKGTRHVSQPQYHRGAVRPGGRRRWPRPPHQHKARVRMSFVHHSAGQGVQPQTLCGPFRAHTGIGPLGLHILGGRRVRVRGDQLRVRQIGGQPLANLRGGNREPCDGLYIPGRGARAHRDGEGHRQHRLGENLQRRTYRQSVQRGDHRPLQRTLDRDARIVGVTGLDLHQRLAGTGHRNRLHLR
ncbi:Uncharacterised protein [Mycobacteroides abscessus]|nr:Uncharacterised protein [Mycobacteroides abscessus]